MKFRLTGLIILMGILVLLVTLPGSGSASNSFFTKVNQTGKSLNKA